MARVIGPLMMIPAAFLATGSLAATLAPHRAVYDLVLTSKSMDLIDGSGRIAIELRQETCGTFDLDYRFIARFAREDATVVTDQQTVSTEDAVANTFSFTTKTFVDGAPAWVLQGKAIISGSSTRVELQEPETRSFNLPLSIFPSAHTMDLIEKAKAGEGSWRAGSSTVTMRPISSFPRPPLSPQSERMRRPAKAGGKRTRLLARCPRSS